MTPTPRSDGFTRRAPLPTPITVLETHTGQPGRRLRRRVRTNRIGVGA